MSKHGIRLLLCSAASIALIVGALFAVPWFRIELGFTQITIDMRSAQICAPGDGCRAISLSRMNGFYPMMASSAFWCALPLALLVIAQCAGKLLTGSASSVGARIGYMLGITAFMSAFAAGFLFAPELDSMADLITVAVERTAAPSMLLAGSLLGAVALRYATHDSYEGGSGVYKPIVVAKGDSGPRLPVTPLHVKPVHGRPPTAPGDSANTKPPTVVDRWSGPTRDGEITKPTVPDRPPRAGSDSDHTTSPGARTKSPSQPPLEARTKSPSQPGTRTKPPSEPPIDLPARTRTSSSGPIDLAARLSGAPLNVSIKPPLPEPTPIPADQIPVAPESGLVIRKRTQSAGPLSADQLPAVRDSASAIRPKSPSSMPVSEATASALRGILKYAVKSASVNSAGITAQQEDGASRFVEWDAIVGIIARRLPQGAPYDGVTFVDIVSTAGATLRLLPWTDVTGAPVHGEGEHRARAFVQLVAARCLDAKLDSWTKVFGDGAGRAAQLPNAKTLDAHDARLA